MSEALSQKKINLLDLEGLSEALSSLGNRYGQWVSHNRPLMMY